MFSFHLLSFNYPNESIGLKFIPNQSELFRYLYPSQCESFRNNSNYVLYFVWWKTIKSQSDLIRLIPSYQSEWIRTNSKLSLQTRSIRINPISGWSKPYFQSESIRMNPRSEWFGLILIENSIWMNQSSDWFKLIWIANLVSDYFGMIRIGSDTDIGMNQNSSDWLGMNFNPMLSSG